MCKNSGFRLRIQKSCKKFGIESKNLIIFSESIPNLLPPPCFLGLTQIALLYNPTKIAHDSKIYLVSLSILKFYLFYFIVDMISVRTFLSQKYKTGDICQGLQQ